MIWALLVGMTWAAPVEQVALRREGSILRCDCTDTDQCAGAERVYNVLRQAKPDLVVTAAWRHLVPQDILDASTVIGFHSAKLPEYPGRAPVPWAILRGDRATENTMLYLTDEPDAGPIIDRRPVAVTNPRAMNEWMGITAAEMLRDHLPALLRGEDIGTPQDRSLRGPLTTKDGWSVLAERDRLATGHG